MSEPLPVPHITLLLCSRYRPGGAGGWRKRWVSSESRPDLGTFQLSAGKFYGDPVRDRGAWGHWKAVWEPSGVGWIACMEPPHVGSGKVFFL